MEKYLSLLDEVMTRGKRKVNRTGVDTIGIIGAHREYDMSHGFPAVTTKNLFYDKSFNEMLGFWRGVDNAADFRALGVNVWDDNANVNEQWLANPNRKGEDDLGRIYGVQARRWGDDSYVMSGPIGGRLEDALGPVDQLLKVYSHLVRGIDDRREIVSHWNPGELGRMALPPCHMFYQFGLEPLTLEERITLYQDKAGKPIQGFEATMQFMDENSIPTNKLHLSMYQRSCDMPLGVPFNIAGYSWLLHVMAHITNTVPGVFNHFMHDVHIYVNQIDGVKEQLTREPKHLPDFWMNPALTSLDDIDLHATPADFALIGYEHHPTIKFPFAV